MKHPLHDNGIYYEHDMDNIQYGHALIMGPKATPYCGGMYLFRFQFFTTYPYAPPIVTFCTGDGITRFHPNLYECGKVCLSILNTWPGEPWSSCQTIRSILLALCTLLTDKPLLAEPQIVFTEAAIQTYSQCVAYRSMEVAMCRQVITLPIEFHMFHTVMCEQFMRIHADMLKAIQELQSRYNKQVLHVSMYRMFVLIDYETLYTLCVEAGAAARQVLDAN
jgi:ubiquitin-protein ligase